MDSKGKEVKVAKIPMLNGKIVRPIRTSKHNTLFTKKFADGRQRAFQKKYNPPMKRLPVKVSDSPTKLEEILADSV